MKKIFILGLVLCFLVLTGAGCDKSGGQIGTIPSPDVEVREVVPN